MIKFDGTPEELAEYMEGKGGYKVKLLILKSPI